MVPSDLWDVFLLFTIPVGGGIPGGVLLAQSRGLAWPVMMVLYFISDVVLAFVFEPLMLLIIRVFSHVAWLQNVASAVRKTLEKSAAQYGHPTGPLALILVAFGVDPMTGRAAAKAAGHGFVTGWLIAITGDMMYFAVLMASTLWFRDVLGDGTWAMFAVFVLMVAIPALIRRVRGNPKATSSSALP
jgi:uncharacterized membrane protein